jgi:hypothetical protein
MSHFGKCQDQGSGPRWNPGGRFLGCFRAYLSPNDVLIVDPSFRVMV